MQKIDKSFLACDPFKVNFGGGMSVFAVGAELKSSICVVDNGVVYLSKPMAGLIEPENYRQFVQTAEVFLKAIGEAPDCVGYDMHPGYASSRYAMGLGYKSFAVQHHYAHIAACMVENNIDEPVIGIAADGTGYGIDSAIWGCEVLVCDLKSFQRAGHLRYFKLFGGDAASVETWRPGAGVMYETFGEDFKFDNVDNDVLNIAKTRIAKGSGLVETSSLGRLFDAVSFLLGFCDRNDTEAKAAMALESAAAKVKNPGLLDYKLTETEAGCIELDFRPVIADIVKRRDKGINKDIIAGQFHETIAAMLTECAEKVSQRTGIKKILLSGGCFLNKILDSRLSVIAEQKGFTVYKHVKSSPGDACIALGQAAVAANNLKEG